MPTHFLPIGHDPGGNYFCLSVGMGDYGAVFFWAHDRPDLDGEQVKRMYAELEADGLDTRRMDIGDAIRAWEARNVDKLHRRPGYGNVYRVSFRRSPHRGQADVCPLSENQARSPSG